MSTAPKKTGINELREALAACDQMSQDAFSEIASIARFALLALETPDGHACAHELEQVLRAIRNRALEAENEINWRCEQMGCNYVDPAARRRDAARCDMRRQYRVGVTADNAIPAAESAGGVQ